MKGKLLHLLLVMALVFSVAMPAALAEDVEEVYFFSSIGGYQKLLEGEVANWNDTVGAEKGIRIVMETNIDNYGTALETMIAGGTYPDIADMYSRSEMLAAGFVRDLYTVPGVEAEIERFKPYLSQGINLQGDKLYSMPLELVPLKMVYNAEIFAECGLTEPPKTWDEMADYAKIITEKGAGKYYGFGWTTMWAASYQRLLMKSTIGSVGRGWFDNTNATYDFTPWEPGVKAIARMYQEGSMFPTPMDQHIDPIRNRFAEGLVGMEIAPSYDVAVYNLQFPANFEWKVADVPALTADGLQYKSLALNRGNVSITTWVTEERLPAVVEAWKFLHSRELYKKLYANSAIIPHEADIIAEVSQQGYENMLKNWPEMSDITNYTVEPVRPDRLLTLEGDNYQTVFTNIMLGDTTWENEIAGLNDRYNKAYQQAKDDGIISVEVYEAPYSAGARE
ncbi:MAG: carbohydrate ABC transporter substrate-binding protein [Clostridiales bacterium]|nr:carbohydrate ABC transporter substrate-binding protein [Clostridiales bacterium]